MSIQADGTESTNSYDCISFMSQTDCAAYTWSMTPSWMTANCPHFPPTPAPTPHLTPPPTPKGFRDNDQDGVADAAADGTCCAQCQGCKFSDCSGATDLAGAASCCPSDFFLRYPSATTGEDTTAYDCVSFRRRLADCTAYWTAANWPRPHHVVDRRRRRRAPRRRPPGARRPPFLRLITPSRSLSIAVARYLSLLWIWIRRMRAPP